MKGKSLLVVGLLLALTGVWATVATTESGSADASAPRVVPIGEMSVERAAHQATLLRTGQVLVTGGCAAPGCENILASAEVYDPERGSFEGVARMTMPRASHEAIALSDGSILVSGGWTGSRSTSTAEIYDPVADSWTSVGEMTRARMSHNAVMLPDGRVLIVGASAEVFDPATGAFSPLGPMVPDGGSYLPVLLADGRVLVTGGESEGGEILRSAQIFDPETGKFERTGSMAVGRVKHAGALLPDGRVLIAGGSDTRGFRGRFASTEIYDPGTGEFRPGPEMRWGRHKIRDAVAVLPSGAIVVAGGAVRPELLDPTDDVFVAAAGELGGPQMFATATVLGDGEVLVLGGYDDRTRPSAAAWMIHPAR